MEIRKYKLTVADLQIIHMPAGAEILKVGEQRGELFLWAMVDPNTSNTPRLIEIVGTGATISAELTRVHIGSVITRSLSVWHVFERVHQK